MPSLRAAALTDIGYVRKENEDRYLLDEKAQIYGVADGVGGLPGGGEAAQVSVDEVTAAINGLSDSSGLNLVAIVRNASNMVVALGRKLSPGTGIGATLTFGCIRGSSLEIGHVGDSRCYGTRAGQCVCLTEDHSVENEARMRRARGEVVYYHESNRNALTRCMGQPPPLEVDVISRPLLAGDRYLFCTDGVTRIIPDEELGEYMMKFDDPRATVDAIVNLAVRRGGPDNATGVVVFVDAV